jgi:hypothetical protein
MDPTEISRVKAYLEYVGKLEKVGIDRDFIFQNFTVGAARPLISTKDEETRTKALNYVAACLKRNEKVTAGDLQSSITVWLKDAGKTCGLRTRSEKLEISKFPAQTEPETEKEAQTEKPIPMSLAEQTRQNKAATEPPVPIPPAPCAARLKEKYNGDGQEHTAPAPKPITDPVPAPCRVEGWGGKCPDLENHIDKTNTILGTRCNLVGVPINQLIEDECPIARAARLKGMPVEEFVKASLLARVDNAKVIKSELPHRVVPNRVDDAQAEQWLTAIVRGLFTKSEQERWERLRKLVEKEGNYDATNCGTLQQICEWMDERAP